MWDCHVGMLFTLRIQRGGIGSLVGNGTDALVIAL